MLLKANVVFLQLLGVAILMTAVVWDKWYCKPQVTEGPDSRSTQYKPCLWVTQYSGERPGFAIPLLLWTPLLVLLDMVLFVCRIRALPTFLFIVTSCVPTALTYFWRYRGDRLPDILCSNTLVMCACMVFLLASYLSLCDDSPKVRRLRRRNNRAHPVFP